MTVPSGTSRHRRSPYSDSSSIAQRCMTVRYSSGMASNGTFELLIHPVPRRGWTGTGSAAAACDELLFFQATSVGGAPAAPAHVQVVEDADQPRTDAERLQVELVGRAEGAQVGLLDEVFSPVGVAGHPPGHAGRACRDAQAQGFRTVGGRASWPDGEGPVRISICERM